MPPVSVSVELDDDEIAELAVWAEFFGKAQAELVADAVRDGFMLLKAEYDAMQHPRPPGPLSEHMDDDVPF